MTISANGLSSMGVGQSLGVGGVCGSAQLRVRLGNTRHTATARQVTLRASRPRGGEEDRSFRGGGGVQQMTIPTGSSCNAGR